MKKTLILDSNSIEKHLRERNMSKTELAHAIDIDLNTLRRWLNGSIKRVKRVNCEKLASALSCQLKDIVVDSKFDAKNLKQSFSQAISISDEENVLIDFINDSKYNDLELLLSILISPFLPVSFLTSTYCNLAILSVFKGEVEKLEERANKALQLSKKVNDGDLRAKAKAVKGISLFFQNKKKKRGLSLMTL